MRLGLFFATLASVGLAVNGDLTFKNNGYRNLVVTISPDIEPNQMIIMAITVLY
jgi:hypothetical protein